MCFLTGFDWSLPFGWCFSRRYVRNYILDHHLMLAISIGFIFFDLCLVLFCQRRFAGDRASDSLKWKWEFMNFGTFDIDNSLNLGLLGCLWAMWRLVSCLILTTIYSLSFTCYIRDYTCVFCISWTIIGCRLYLISGRSSWCLILNIKENCWSGTVSIARWQLKHRYLIEDLP